MKIILILLLSITALSKTKCIGHRGYKDKFLENSYAGFKAALESNADGIEFDFRLTSDGHSIIMHDRTLARTAKSKPGKDCKVNKLIKKQTLKEIQDNCILENGEKIYSLKEFLEAFSHHDKYFFFEIKDKEINSQLDLIPEYIKDPKKVRIITFYNKILDKVRSKYKDSAYWNQVGLMDLDFWPFSRSGEHDKSISWFSFKATPYRNWEKEHSIWTVNNKDRLSKLIHHYEVDFITTNKPILCSTLK